MRLTHGFPMRRIPFGFVILVAFLDLHCFNDHLSPVAPTWDVTMTVPWADRSVSLASLVERNSTLLSTQGDQIVYSASLGGPTTSVGDQVTLTSFNSAGSVKLGHFGVTLDPVDIPVAIPAFPGGSTGVIGPSSFDVPDISGIVESGVSVDVASGTARLTIRNQSPIPLTVTGPVNIVNAYGTLLSFTFNGAIQSGDSASSESDLSGKLFSSDASVENITLASPGSNGQSVTMPPYPLSLTLNTQNLVAQRATLPRLSPQVLVSGLTAALAMSDSTKIQSILAYSGQLDFVFTSLLTTTVRLRFRSSEVLRADGTEFQDSILIDGGATRTFSLDLHGCRLESTPGGLLDSLHMSTDVVIPSVVSQSTTLQEADLVLVVMSCSKPMVAESATVVLAPTRVDLRTTVPFQFGSLSSKFTGSLNIPSASLGLRVNSNVGFPADLTLRLVGRTTSGDSAVLVLPPGQQRVLPGTDTLHFNDAEAGQFLSRFGARMPDSLTITGSALINPADVYNPTPSGVGTISRNSTVSGSIGLIIPLKLSLSTGTYRDTLDWGDTNGDGTTDNGFTPSDLNNVNQGMMFLEVENGLPVQLSTQLALLDSSGKVLLTLPLSNGEYGVGSAQVDANGFATAATSTTMSIALNETQIHQFAVARNIAYLMSLSTGGSGPVVLRTTDLVHIRAWSTLSYRVNQ
jgi:hypothetical protein